MTALTNPRSLWHETGPAVASDAALPHGTDVAVAGAGLAGVATALMLARAGHRVVVLDAAEVGARTTGGSTAKLSVLQGTVYQQLRKSAGDQVLQAYAQAQLVAQRWLRKELADAVDAIQPQTAFTYATTPSGVDAVEAEFEAMTVCHLRPERTGASDIGLPFAVSDALRMPGQSQLHPVRMLARLAAQARELGVVFVGGCRLQDVSRDTDGLHVRTTQGVLRAQWLAVTTGFPVIDRAGFFATLIPSRQLVGAYRLPPAAAALDGMYLSVDPVPRSLRTASDADGAPVLLVGGDAFVPGRADTSRVLNGLDDWVKGVFPGAQRKQWWAAQDYSSVDQRPFFGVVPNTGGRVLAASGFAKWGMTNAVAGALAMTGIVTGDKPVWAEPFSTAGITGRGVASAASASGSVARELVRGWINPREAHETPSRNTRARMIRRGIRPVAESIVEGEHCIVSGVCTHMGGVLRWNTAERSWDCPLHGSRFAPDGRVLEGPATRDLRPVGTPSRSARPSTTTSPPQKGMHFGGDSARLEVQRSEKQMSDPRPPEEIDPVTIDPDMSSDQQDEELEETPSDDNPDRGS